MDVCLERKVKNAENVGRQFDLTLADQDDILAAQAAHEPTKLQNYVLTRPAQGFGLVSAGDIVRSHQHDGERTCLCVMLELFDDRPAAMGLLAQDHGLYPQGR